MSVGLGSSVGVGVSVGLGVSVGEDGAGAGVAGPLSWPSFDGIGNSVGAMPRWSTAFSM